MAGKGWDTDVSDINAYQGGVDIYQRLQARKAAGSILRAVAGAPAGNALIGPGVGGVTSAAPALWGTAVAFAVGAICLSVAWLSPSRARAPA